jgi:hypothetical protein
LDPVVVLVDLIVDRELRVAIHHLAR